MVFITLKLKIDMKFIQVRKKFSRLRDEPKSLGTQYQIQNETQISENQKVSKMIKMN